MTDEEIFDEYGNYKSVKNYIADQLNSIYSQSNTRSIHYEQVVVPFSTAEDITDVLNNLSKSGFAIDWLIPVQKRIGHINVDVVYIIYHNPERN